MQTCRSHGNNPEEYLEDVMRRLMSHNSQKIHELPGRRVEQKSQAPKHQLRKLPWADVTLTYVTNGVYIPSWKSPAAAQLYGDLSYDDTVLDIFV
ncbi:MAG TPA: transposase domain-containing protein [Chlamydiales bacterium]|nr:transposase domain-containing protein [Chlamydiales bacterium]